MKKILSFYIFSFFALFSNAQENVSKNSNTTTNLSYTFVSKIKNEHKNQDNSVIRKVLVYKTELEDKIVRYDFFCIKYEFQGPNNVNYIKKVSYIFDEITLFVDRYGKIIDITKPSDMDERWGETKREILLDYTGKVIDEYLYKIDTILEDKDELMETFQEDNMYGVFLKGQSELEFPSELSKTKIDTKEGTKKISLKPNKRGEIEEYTFKENVLIYGLKTEDNVTYEIIFDPQP